MTFPLKIGAARKVIRYVSSLCACAWLVGCGNGASSSVASGGSSAMSAAGNAGNSAGSSGNSSTSNGGAGAGSTAGGGAPGTAGGDSAGSGNPASGAGGGSTMPPDMPEAGRVRTVIPFDSDWLFNKGNVTGAEQAGFADSAWRGLSVPHDWSIEGPFDQNAPTTGRGGYLPSGIAWYRKHFTLPQAALGRKVFLEFDGVMANSDVYVNGTHIGQHPNGYLSFRYDISASVKFGAENVIAVKTDTSTQPASRYYAGAGIYRHVRLLATDPVHVAQYATFVTTPAPSAASATVHVTTTVTNSGTESQSVTVQGVVSDPLGVALAPVATPAQTVAAGASASFTFDVPVQNPKLWDLSTPNLYRLTTNVQVGGATIDDDSTPFGIREIKFNGGMTLNGKSVKFQGVAIHQDFHGLGMAPPQRAIQRRLAQLKALGVNAIRTAHEPPSPDFLELTDRMGFLVLDEFSDVWTGHKYADVGDYSAYFNKPASSPSGMPPVPGVTSGATWWQTDLTGMLMRDRNHASVALYSLGNEIHESLSTRTPILTKMVALSHTVDPSRNITQALLQPGTAGDVGAATNMLLDVWGDNYHIPECLQALPNAPTKSGLLTEMGTETSTWTTVMANPGLTGEFLWTGVDYLGEADGAWPTVGGTPGIMDEMGQVRSIGYSWQNVWGAPKKSAPPTGTSASKLVVTSDHPSILSDWNDVAFVAAAVSDSAGHVVPSSTASVTFSLTGPGKIIAVDSGSMIQESFRGSTRKAFNGLAYAIVQATGAGAITVSASATGLTAGSATIQGATGTFVPCSETCN
jgi:beta-galactosidase